MSTATHALPAPLVTAKRHPWQWLRNKLVLIGAGALLVHVGTLIVVAVYYGLTQNHAVKPHWDGLFHTSWWPTWRHLLRGVGEGILGGTLGQMVIYNHYRKGALKPANVIDRFEMWLHIPNIKDRKRVSALQYLAFPLLVLLYAAPGFALGGEFVHLVGRHLHDVKLAAHPDFWQRIETLWTSSVSYKIVGLFASIFLARRIGRAYYDDIQLYFVDRRIGRGQTKPPWYWTPNIKARFNENLENDYARAQAAHEGAKGGVLPWLLSGGILLGVILAGCGFYVLTYVATGG